MNLKQAEEAGYQLVHKVDPHEVARPADKVKHFPGRAVLERISATGVHRIHGTSVKDALRLLAIYLERTPGATGVEKVDPHADLSEPDEGEEEVEA